MKIPKNSGKVCQARPNESYFCRRCNERLKSFEHCYWLELSLHTGKYQLAGEIPEEESQGFFEFGKACAIATLQNDGYIN